MTHIYTQLIYNRFIQLNKCSAFGFFILYAVNLIDGAIRRPSLPSAVIFAVPFQRGNISDQEQQFNSMISSVRECIEWEFGKILKNFAFLDFRKNLKVLLSPLVKYYLVGGLLTNCHTCLYGSHTCLYGSQTSTYFNLEPPLLEHYLASTMCQA